MTKRKHQLLTDSERDQILAIPTERDHLARLYNFEPSDIEIIGTRGSAGTSWASRCSLRSCGTRASHLRS